MVVLSFRCFLLLFECRLRSESESESMVNPMAEEWIRVKTEGRDDGGKSMTNGGESMKTKGSRGRFDGGESVGRIVFLFLAVSGCGEWMREDSVLFWR